MKYTPLIGGAQSGSIGGLTASRNSAGSYYRARAVPVQPNTARQMTVRALFASLVNYWTNTLTSAERGLWDVYGANVTTTDALGSAITNSGQNWFVALNLPRLQAKALDNTLAWTIIEVPPTVFDTGTPATSASIVTVTSTSTTLNVSIAGLASGEGGALLYVGPAQNPSRSFYKGPYRLAEAQDIDGFSLEDPDTSIVLNGAGDTWAGPWGTVSAGDVIPVKVNLLYVDGRYPLAYRALVTVQ